jgi:L-asparaginase II
VRAPEIELLAEVVRSGYVEGLHHGTALAVRGDGTVALELGAVDRPCFPRSCNKPFQALALLRVGWDPPDRRQLALACSSHAGEPGHVEVVRDILPETSLLQCPPELPLSEEAGWQLIRDGGSPSPLTMNCSGKHAAMLQACRVNGWPLEDYLDPEHPLQLAVQGTVEDLAGERVQHVAVDGCGAPQHALSLRAVARAYRRLLTDDECRPVADAMRENPWYVGGTGRDATRLMEGVPGLVAKDGAEGVYAAALPDGAVAVVKVADGAARARVPVLVALLRLLGCEAAVLDELATTPVLGGGRPVGEVRVAGRLAAEAP